MDIDRAIELVRKLANGVDPATGERSPPGSPYQQADTITGQDKGSVSDKGSNKGSVSLFNELSLTSR